MSTGNVSIRPTLSFFRMTVVSTCPVMLRTYDHPPVSPTHPMQRTNRSKSEPGGLYSETARVSGVSPELLASVRLTRNHRSEYPVLES
jgi:hypothetical protein